MQKYSLCGRYELTGKKKTVEGVVVHQYKVRDDIDEATLPNGLGVGAGETLGHISSWNDIADDGVVLYHGVAIDSYIGDSSRVSGTVIHTHVSGNALVYKDAVVRNSRIHDEVIIDGKAVINNVSLRGGAFIEEGATINLDDDDKLRIVYSGDIPGDAEITKPKHLMAMTVYTTQSLDTLLYRTKSGEPKILMGCWDGTLDELEYLFMQVSWVETVGNDCVRLRPQMLALVKYFREIVATW